MGKVIFCFILFLFSFFPNALANPVIVSSQKQFDEFLSKVQAGIAMDILLTKGTYVLNENVIANAPLQIHGKDAVIIGNNVTYTKKDAVKQTSTHYVCKLKGTIKSFSLFLDENDKIVPVSESVLERTKVNTCQRIEGEYSDKPMVQIKIPLPENLKHLKNKTLEEAYGYFDCAWTEIDFSVSKTDDQFIYGTTMTDSNTGSYNNEKNYYENDVRYVLFNAEIKQGCIYYDNNYIYIPKNINEVSVVVNRCFDEDTPSITFLSDLEMDGVVFKNFNGIYIKSSFQHAVKVSDCEFYNTLSYAINLLKTNSGDEKLCQISNCKFVHCSLLRNNVVNIGVVKTCNASCSISNCIINRYDDNALMYKNCTGALRIDGNVVVDKCTIFNTPRCHLYVTRGNVVATNNVLYNTDRFNSYKERNLSSDLGIIYITSFTLKNEYAIVNKTNKVELSGNLLYGAYAYGRDARGIFIDNGRGDIICRNNIIANTQNYSQCFSIDARDAKNLFGTSSIRNVYEGNVLDIKYRLASGDDVPAVDRPVICGNIILNEKGTVIKDVNTSKNDICAKGSIVMKKKKAKMNRALVRLLKKEGIYRNVIDHIK